MKDTALWGCNVSSFWYG